VFTYDVATLIELFKTKPCLCDKTSDSYKDIIEKLKAWREICAFLEGDFHQMGKNKEHKISKYTFINPFSGEFIITMSHLPGRVLNFKIPCTRPFY